MKNTAIFQFSKTSFRSLRNASLFFGCAALCATAVMAQLSTEQTGSAEDASTQATSSPVALVYVTTAKGIDLYGAASNGALSAVSGSPFKISGQMIGSNGSYLVSAASADINTYKIATNGAIESNVSTIDTKSYSGGKCGNPVGAVLDHTGADIYVSLKGANAGDGNELCDALQTSSITSSNGDLTYKGDLTVDYDLKISGSDSLPVLLGNNKFAYSLEGVTDSCEATLNMFERESSGALELAPGQSVTYPNGPAGGYYYYPMYPSNSPSSVDSVQTSLITDDGTDHLAIALYAMNDAPCGNTKSPQLASFTADSRGNLVSTNTAENMPTVAGTINAIRMSPAGNLLAVATGTGVQIFHFNGASPITKFTGVIGTSGYVSDIQWDKNNHLYAINGATGKLHVYTVTTSSAVEASGSPYSIGASASPIALVVVSK
jgi:hypothetical protein